ncbi:hypothetical protein Lalb_Chr15g0089131 [Lupinus albus]|uniref:Transmembrane protein n=1 Tax=Lupinus albus TaxID=3870 RepID=A0A6A4PCU3_LUPAL|nr:hypothetical protein Lalb_Chr15g0089131 [Lupinus albus]
MDQRSALDKDTEVDLESGMPLIGDDSMKVSTPGTSKQGRTLLSKISGCFVRGSVNSEDRPSLHNESNLSEVSVDEVELENKPMMGQDSVRHAEKSLVKEKRKKASNKKAAKPPRPPQAPTLDAADRKLIREISKLAMLKRARVERMKSLKKMKAAQSSSSSNSSTWAMILTVVFVIVIIIQGLSSGKSPEATFQGSPLSASGTENGLISVQYQLNPSTSDSNAPGSESHNFV